MALNSMMALACYSLVISIISIFASEYVMNAYRASRNKETLHEINIRYIDTEMYSFLSSLFTRSSFGGDYPALVTISFTDIEVSDPKFIEMLNKSDSSYYTSIKVGQESISVHLTALGKSALSNMPYPSVGRKEYENR